MRTAVKCVKTKNARAKQLFFIVRYANVWLTCCRRRCLKPLIKTRTEQFCFQFCWKYLDFDTIKAHLSSTKFILQTFTCDCSPPGRVGIFWSCQSGSRYPWHSLFNARIRIFPVVELLDELDISLFGVCSHESVASLCPPNTSPSVYVRKRL